MLNTHVAQEHASTQSRALPKHLHHAAALAGAITLIGFVALFMHGCAAAPPRAHLDDYREAFNAARDVAEQVLIETEIIWQEAEHIPLHDVAGDQADDWLAFDASPDRAGDSTREHIDLRLQFWRIAARYNEALLALAEGRSPDDASRSASCFADALRDLPIRQLTTIAGHFGALHGVLGESLAAIENHHARQRIEQAVLAGAPLVDQMFELMREDVTDLYDVHLVRYHQQRRAIDESLQLELLPSFQLLYESTGPREDKAALFNAVRGVLAGDLRYRDADLPAFGDSHTDDAPYSAQDHAQLLLLRDSIQQVGRQRRAIDANMQQTKQLLESYHTLLTIAQHQLHALQQAVEVGEPAPAEAVLHTSLAVFRELVNYRQGATP